MKLPERNLPWAIAWEGVVEIARSEGCRLSAYRDIAGIWTIGWGETEGVREGMQWTQRQADEQLALRIAEFAKGVRGLLKNPALPEELAAMVSLAYNIGLTAFARSSVRRAHERGDHLAAARAFALWNQATINGKRQPVRGLTLRRAREAALYLSAQQATRAAAPLDDVPDADVGRLLEMPAAEPESRMAASPIAQSGALSLVSGGVAAAAGVSSDVRDVAYGLGINPLLIVAVLAIAVGAVVLWQRIKQRREGWA